jgi:DNA gyrase subunit B
MTEGNAKDSMDLFGQLAECEENDPARCELFIVEGDLAGESCKIGRDRRTQAILPFSAEKAIDKMFTEKASVDKILSQSDIKSLISILGAGIGKIDFDIEKLRYHKIIFLCDDHAEWSPLRTMLLTFFYGELPQLLAHTTAGGETKSYVYLAQPPLYQIWDKGQYIKDNREMNRYRIRKAAKEIAVKVKRTGKKLKGRDLSILLERMLEFDDYYRRLQGKLIDQKLVDTLLETMIGSNGLIQKNGPQLPDIFADESLLGTVRAALSEAGYKADLILDEESGLSAIEVQNVSSGGGVLIDRKLFTQIEFQRAVALYQSFIQPSTPPFLVTEGELETEIKSRGDLLIYALNMANKNLAIQRFKNLSEMNPEQVWESVMNPEKRSLLQVTIGDAVKND